MNKSTPLLFTIGIFISFTGSACNQIPADNSQNSNAPLKEYAVAPNSSGNNSVKPLNDYAAVPNSSGNSSVKPSSDYVVAPNGSDNNSGTLERPFQTVQKCANVVKPGGTCFLRAGIYREAVRPAVSGTTAAPVTFAAYNNEKVTISGADPVVGWAGFRGSIFRANVSLPVNGYSDTGFLANQVFVNGEMMPEARWPNIGSDPMRPKLTGCCVKSLGGTAATVENNEIPNLPEGWAGATVWTNEWYTTRTGTVTGGSGGKLTAKMTAPWDRGGFWFYLVGKSTLR